MLHLFKFEIEVRDLQDDGCVVQVFDVGTNNISIVLQECGDPHPNPFVPQSGSIAFWSVIPIHSIMVTTPFGSHFFDAALGEKLHEFKVDRSPGTKIVVLPMFAQGKADDGPALPTYRQNLPIALPKGAKDLDVHILQTGKLPEPDAVERMRKICQNAKSSDEAERGNGGQEKSPPPSTSASQ